jgi:hypothetical protein
MLGDFIDENFFGGADGLVFVAEGGEELLDVVGVLVAHLGDGGAEAVTESVLSDAGFAVVGARSGGGLGVATVGFNLGFGGHVDSPLVAATAGVAWIVVWTQ